MGVGGFFSFATTSPNTTSQLLFFGLVGFFPHVHQLPVVGRGGFSSLFKLVTLLTVFLYLLYSSEIPPWNLLSSFLGRCCLDRNIKKWPYLLRKSSRLLYGSLKLLNFPADDSLRFSG